MNSNLSQNVKFTRVKNSVTAGTAEIDSTIIDMSGFDGVIFIALCNTIVDASVVTLKAQGNATNATSGMADIAGATTNFTSSSNSNVCVWIDVFRPQLEFVRAVMLRTTQNLTLDGILAIQYKGSKAPTIHDATTILQGALAAF